MVSFRWLRQWQPRFYASGFVAASADDMKTYEITIKDKVFTPNQITVKAGEPFRIKLTNANPMPVELESSKLGSRRSFRVSPTFLSMYAPRRRAPTRSSMISIRRKRSDRSSPVISQLGTLPMLGALIIVFREVFEAGLVIGIVLAATRLVAGSRWWIAGGVLAGIAGSALLAMFAEVVSKWADGFGQELFNAASLPSRCACLSGIISGWPATAANSPPN